MRKQKVSFNDSPGSPSSLEEPRAILGGSAHSLYSSITTGLRQSGDSWSLLSCASLVMEQVHHISLGDQGTGGATLGWTFMCDCIFVDRTGCHLGAWESPEAPEAIWFTQT